MKTFREHTENTTYLGPEGEHESFLVFLSRTRDSNCLEESNFISALKLLGGENNDVIVIRCGHWACGWVESILVRPDTTAHAQAEKMIAEIEDYPVLNEDHFSALETEKANEIWRDCYDAGERLEYMRDHKSQFDGGLRSLLQNARGDYFSGYASELLCD